MGWRSKVLGLLVGLGCWVTAPVWAQTNPQTELRGVWLTNVDSDVLFSRERLRQAIARLQRLRFNTLYPVVYNGGYTLFPSATMAKYAGVALDPNPGLQGRDVLQEAIAEGRARQMAVIPWLEYGLMAPEDSELVKRNPTWVTRRQDGSALITLGANNEVRLVRLNPAHPEVRQFLTELVQEIVQKYEVDGIQFDDHFGWPVDMGYDEFTVGLYQQDHNGNAPPIAVRDPEWMRWRARLLTDLWVSIFAKVRLHRPKAVVSLAPNPRLFSYQAYLQDWYRWARLGLIDELIVQVYRDNLGTYATELTTPELYALRSQFPVAVGVLTGLRIRPVDMGLISDQVQIARLFGLDGFSYFFYETLGERDGGFQTLHGEPRSRPRRK
jgi:uncharacterized lipoprotein YddW (UPF0748 family)